MSINYYPNDVVKMRTHVVEQQQKPDLLYSVCGEADITATGLTATVWSPRSWNILRVSLNFSASNAKTYSISTMRGTGIVTSKNDRIWMKMDGVAPQPIILPQGFYDGTTLSAALKAALDASNLPSTGKPFVVTYSASTNLFSITSAAGDVELYVSNARATVRQDSTAAHLLGFTTNPTPASPISSNAEVPALGTKTVIVSAATSSVLNVVATDPIAMTIDNALIIETTTAPVAVAYEVVYKILDA